MATVSDKKNLRNGEGETLKETTHDKNMFEKRTKKLR